MLRFHISATITTLIFPPTLGLHESLHVPYDTATAVACTERGGVWKASNMTLLCVFGACGTNTCQTLHGHSADMATCVIDCFVCRLALQGRRGNTKIWNLSELPFSRK